LVLRTGCSKNHTGISRISDANREGFLITAVGLFHKKELVDLFVFAWLQVFPTYTNLKVFNAPFQGLLMSGEKHVEPVSFDGAASVENLYRPAVAIAGDEHFSAKRVSSICRHKGIAGLYFVPAGRYPV
jgi:hypothetical protein